MIVNMPAQGTSSLLEIDIAQERNDYNLLKRKLDTEDNRQIEGEKCSVNYQGPTVLEDTVWKKRLLQWDANKNSDGNTNCFIANSFNANSLSDFQNEAEHSVSIATTAAHINTTGDMTFNLIGSSSFLNDLFTYDSNLIVPVSASLVTSSTNLDGAEVSSASAPTFTVPTSVCATPSFDDDSNWQATDLLELDHRYNSGLQMDITELNPTVTLKHTDVENVLTATEAQSQSLQSHPSQSAICPINFLVPAAHRQDRSKSSPNSKYRQLNQIDSESDFEDKNLSWLLNFKFDEFPHLSPDVTANSTQPAVAQPNKSTSPSTISMQRSNPSASPESISASTSNAPFCQNDGLHSPKTSNKAGRKFEELVLEATTEVDGSDIVVGENIVIEDSPIRAPKKPPFTYTELIEYALEDKGELTVSGIYQWISDRFPYYKSNDDRWKNSVRHNLSINPHFRKGIKAPQGAGHLWTISSGDSAENVLAWEHKKQRLDLFFKMESMNRERLQQHHQKQLLEQQQQKRQDNTEEQSGAYDEAAIAAAAIAQELLDSAADENCSSNIELQSITSTNSTITRHTTDELAFNDLMSDEELRKTAGQILNGMHRDVEVQPVHSIINNYHDVLLDNGDYLNPIHKDVSVHESGLRSNSMTAQLHSLQAHHSHGSSSQYYVTEIDPLELGIQMTHQMTEAEVESEEVLFNDDFNLNYFGYGATNDIVA